MYPRSSPSFSALSPPPPTSLTPPARDAHPVSYRFLSPRTGNGWSPWIHELQGASRKWSNYSTCDEEIEQPQQRGGRTGGVHSHRHIYKQVPNPKTPSDFPYSCWHWNHNTGSQVWAKQRCARSTETIIIIAVIYTHWSSCLPTGVYRLKTGHDGSSTEGYKVNNFFITALIQFGAPDFLWRRTAIIIVFSVRGLFPSSTVHNLQNSFAYSGNTFQGLVDCAEGGIT